MSSPARKLLIFLVAGAALAAGPRALIARRAATQAAAVSGMNETASCIAAPVAPRRRPLDAEEGCSEAGSPALARQ
jgi:hypothetical protein